MLIIWSLCLLILTEKELPASADNIIKSNNRNPGGGWAQEPCYRGKALSDRQKTYDQLEALDIVLTERENVWKKHPPIFRAKYNLLDLHHVHFQISDNITGLYARKQGEF